jgi:hypothetical protein
MRGPPGAGRRARAASPRPETIAMQEFTTPAAQQTIQAILTPVLMISACGLLLLGLNNRYTTVVGRLRMLNDEKRRKLADPEAIDREYVDMIRFESVIKQIPSLVVRSNYLRRALIFLWINVLMSLCASLTLGLSLFFRIGIATVAVYSFLAGLVSASIGVVFALMDIAIAHRVLNLETELY